MSVTAQKHFRRVMRQCANLHGLLFKLIFAHIKLKPCKKKRHSDLSAIFAVIRSFL